MTAPTVVSAQLVTDLNTALARLRLARTIGDTTEATVAEKRLNWLLDTKLRKDT